ncbi:helix-turn-helix transcriptional regulator [Fodinibius halophilus]|uniref:Helix-turn-helix transcriptional regulator n=1 Tax=Fodinibius halophilus TaxID=1736908 RepID=A0A6M1SVP8_9BACT|nr:AraC family transcriptional regulator [Fodinibius halophilus]NGP87656.1 helix-turn-helix transcriptional regulator [Fodinibius halophilus]
MKSRIEYSQQLFSVADFPQIMGKSNGDIAHYEDKQQFINDNKHQSTVLTYRKLSDDILLLHQQTECHRDHRIHFTPQHRKRHYQLKFLLTSNNTIQIRKNGDCYDIFQGFMTLYNNTTGYTIDLPKGFAKESLQAIISHRFLDQYVSPQSVQNKMLYDTLTQQSDQLFVLPKAPSPVKKKLIQIADQLNRSEDQNPPNLRLLNIMSTMLVQLFQMDLPHVDQSSGIDNLKENVAHRVAEYLESRLTYSFPGMEFLATQFGISVSGLKRHFKRAFATTPFQYYRDKQMQLARNKLKNTDKNVGDIAQHMGFDDSSNFIRAFKAEFDITPGQYQQQQAAKH